MPKLIVMSGMDAGTEIELGAGVHRVGRKSSNRVVLRDRSVSREHCELLVVGGEVVVADLGSANGTSLDGVSLVEPARLRRDGVIRFGGVSARIELDRLSWDESTDAVSAVFDMRVFDRKPLGTERRASRPLTDPAAVPTGTALQIETETSTDRLERGRSPELELEVARAKEIHQASDGHGLSPAAVMTVAAAAAILAMLALWLVFGAE